MIASFNCQPDFGVSVKDFSTLSQPVGMSGVAGSYLGWWEDLSTVGNTVPCTEDPGMYMRWKENRMLACTQWFTALLSTTERMWSPALSPCHLTALQWWSQPAAVSQIHLPLFSCSCLSGQHEAKPREIKLQQRSNKRYVRTSTQQNAQFSQQLTKLAKNQITF